MGPDFGLAELKLQSERNKKRLDDLSFAADEAQSNGMEEYVKVQEKDLEAMEKHNAMLRYALVTFTKECIASADKQSVESLARTYYENQLEEN